jgi:predicted metal-binding membrane protein
VYLSIGVLSDALEKQTPSAAVLAAISIVSLLALAWAATNYLLRPMQVAPSPAVELKPAE